MLAATVTEWLVRPQLSVTVGVTVAVAVAVAAQVPRPRGDAAVAVSVKVVVNALLVKLKLAVGATLAAGLAAMLRTLDHLPPLAGEGWDGGLHRATVSPLLNPPPQAGEEAHMSTATIRESLSSEHWGSPCVGLGVAAAAIVGHAAGLRVWICLFGRGDDAPTISVIAIATG